MTEETAAQRRDSKRASVTKAMDYKAVLPERFNVDFSKRYMMDKLQLGAGGFGKVFVATDTNFEHRLVAVKKITKTGSSSENAWHEEVEVMKALDHPNICKLYETFEEGKQLYFVMEYLEGGEVFDKIMETGYISESICAEITSQVISGLRYAHGKKIAHRDLKPENIVLCTKDAGDYRIKIIDWGLSTSFEGQQMTSPVGSFTYAAPEVVLAKRNKASYSAACDLWSTGVVTYVMLCGKPPFWGATKQHLKNAMNEKYPMSASPWDIISDEGKDFIKKLLKSKPEQRMTSEDASQHTWVLKTKHDAAPTVRLEVMKNLQAFNDQSMFVQFCVTAVAKQLDHSQLKEIYSVFQEMDKNGDGTLSTEEIAQCYSKLAASDTSGTGDAQNAQMKAVMGMLDLDGSGAVDYTEFCAAALGENFSQKVEAVWAAFKAFDIDDNGELSRDEVQKILSNMTVQQAWTESTCAAAADKLMKRFDKDGDASINFDEWMEFMKECWSEGSSSTAEMTNMSGLYMLLGQDMAGADEPAAES